MDVKTAFVIALVMNLATAAAAEPVPRRALDLRVGDVRNYMMPSEYRDAISAPDTDRYTIVVEGHRQPAEVQSLRAVPMGLGAVLWSFRHPASAWRLFAPDVHAAPPARILTRVPPPVFRPGP